MVVAALVVVPDVAEAVALVHSRDVGMAEVEVEHSLLAYRDPVAEQPEPQAVLAVGAEHSLMCSDLGVVLVQAVEEVERSLPTYLDLVAVQLEAAVTERSRDVMEVVVVAEHSLLVGE